MPYYIGAGTPEWDELDWEESGDPPDSLYTYVEPWVAETTVLAFPETPGPEPLVPRERPAYRPPPPAPKPGFFARLFGKKAPLVEAPPAEEVPQPTPAQLIESYKARQKATADHALWKVSALASRCRALGVKQVFGSYDGGGDESFTDFRGVKMSDGRVITAESLGILDHEAFRAEIRRLGRLPQAREEDEKPKALAARILGREVDDQEAGWLSDLWEMVPEATAALMGSFDAGEFLLHGVITIDLDTCTITDEKNADVVFGDKMPSEA
jgi:hypothetical protein